MLDQGKTVAAKTDAGTEPSSNHRLEYIKTLLQKEFGETVFPSWISPITLHAAGGGTLELAVPTRFMRDWVKAHYADRIRSLWSQNYGGIGRVDIIISAKPATTLPEEEAVSVFERTQIANDTVPAVE